MAKKRKYTEFRFDLRRINKRIRELSANLMKNSGRSDLFEHGLQILHERVIEKPRHYRRFGPYWWALKTLLIKHGYHYRDSIDVEIAQVYCGKNDLQTMVMADTFYMMYLERWFDGTQEFMLDADSGESYLLWDDDLEDLQAQFDAIEREFYGERHFNTW